MALKHQMLIKFLKAHIVNKLKGNKNGRNKELY